MRSVFRRKNLGNLLVIGCILLMTLFIYNTEQRLAGNAKELRGDAKQLGSQHVLLVESCVRLNILRAEDNVSHYADYKLFRIVQSETEAPPSRPLTSQEQKNRVEFLAQLDSAVKAKAWTPLTDCKRAVDASGVRYRPPQPIAFYKHLPPRRDLYPPAGGAALYGG
jgi:hypothetical protein